MLSRSGSLPSTAAINGEHMKLLRESLIVLAIAAVVTGLFVLLGNLTQLWPVTSFGEYAYITCGVAVVVGVSSVARRKTKRGEGGHEC